MAAFSGHFRLRYDMEALLAFVFGALEKIIISQLIGIIAWATKEFVFSGSPS
jgi:hypothetical protein